MNDPRLVRKDGKDPLDRPALARILVLPGGASERCQHHARIAKGLFVGLATLSQTKFNRLWDIPPIVAATARAKRALKGKERIALRVGKVIGKHKMAKHFALDITEHSFAYRRRAESIAREAALDGLYVVRTSVPAHTLDAEQTVRAYKDLSAVERAFRCLKTVDLKVRPIFHRSADRVRAHVLLCMLAYYVEWHLRARLKPVLFDDEDRASVVAPAEVSDSANDKARTLLDDLATIAKNRVAPRLPNTEPFEMVTRPTPLQREVFKLLRVRLEGPQ